MKIYDENTLNDILDSCKSIEELKAKLDDATDTLDVDVLDMQEGEVIIVSFPETRAEISVDVIRAIQSMYPSNPVIGVVDDIELLIENAEDALSMLDKMKDKISSMTNVTSVRDQILLK